MQNYVYCRVFTLTKTSCLNKKCDIGLNALYPSLSGRGLFLFLKPEQLYLLVWFEGEPCEKVVCVWDWEGYLTYRIILNDDEQDPKSHKMVYICY